MEKQLKKYKNYILLPAAILIAPLIYGVLSLISFNIFPFLSRIPVIYQSLGVVYLMLVYWFIDAGKTVFISYFLLTPSLLVLTFIVLIYLKRIRILGYWLFYYYLVGFIIFLVICRGFWINQGTYHPPVQAKTGVVYHVVGFPLSRFDNFYKELLVRHEGKGEKYEIVGWLNNETLIYKKWGSWGYNLLNGKEIKYGQEQRLQYSTISRKSTGYHNSIENFSVKTCKSTDCLKNLAEAISISFSGCQNSYISPGEDKFACIASYLYGPQDIMIFEK